MSQPGFKIQNSNSTPSKPEDMSRGPRYALLPSEGGSTDDVEIEAYVPRPSRKKAENLVYLSACIGGILSSTVSVILLLSGIGGTAQQSMSASLPTRRASTYLGLDKVDFTGSPTFPPISSFAHVVLQADLQSPQRAMSEDDRSYYSPEGVIYPDDRHILATPNVSTVVQFRNLDYGMERCALWISTPPVNMSHNPAIRMDDVTIDIWELDMADELFPPCGCFW
ncbi:hypothetical protein E1B28_005133 [Marasmius oreades]|uniref:Ubiquitin 3 binding protein But2 C-terminal domain-containing protein n=1 Tax=Marasmius oreades TaxID=181124 RepID=A0A9P8ADP2_9AGAR|nr:uncharacterized protein E1B28_005133 [Marasmius oreades]KAG7097814.1 hypothetical protein E1B28_005133 [Marasmius oreades]